jgi:tetratricopeptide (TPR) repeat protein
MTDAGADRSLAGLAALVLLLASLSYVRNGFWIDSVTLWEDAAAKAPGKGRVNYELGRAYGFQGRWDDAYRSIEKAKRQDAPMFDRLLLSTAEAFRRQGRLPEAEREYRAMLAQDPDRPETRVDLGCVLYAEQKLAEAHREFSEAIRLDAGYAAAYANRGVVNVEMKNPGAGADDLLQAVMLEPGNADYRTKLGFAYLLLGFYDEAVAAYDGALRIEPGNERAQKERAEALKRAREGRDGRRKGN